MSSEGRSARKQNRQCVGMQAPLPHSIVAAGNNTAAAEVLAAPHINSEPESTLTILLPALNEEVGIAKVLEELQQARLSSHGYRTSVVVVDGQSVDRTRDVAQARGARVFVQFQRGKGKAIRGVVPLLQGDYVVMLDADGSYPVGAIMEIVRQLEAGYEVVSGTRLGGSIHPGAMRGLHRLGNRFLTALANLLFRPARTTDLCTGFWGFRVDILKKMRLTADGFDLEADIFTEAVNLGLRHTEVPIAYEPREGREKLSWKNGIGIARTLFKKRLDGTSQDRSPDGLGVNGSPARFAMWEEEESTS